MSAPEPHKQSELAGLPTWLYPAGFWITLVLLGVGVFWPHLSYLGVICIGTVPVLAALWVAVSAWSRDRRLSYAALAALGGLILVVIVKQFIRR
ncbi:hypothetical protein [Deinococcus sp.]|uniref:hypothetical protein n=1 Tax=Deinococcus sp. TaxID=47478 RepID=UPI0025C5E4A3|nr:hypothetical protein [Deinococcus sp.]